MQITAAMVRELRDATDAPMMECKQALKKAEGDMDKALKILRTQGMAVAQKKASREAKDGTVYAYIHMGGKMGVLVEVNCETDFVARTDDFKELCKDIAMHIAAANPLYVSRDQIPAQKLEEEKSIYKEQAEKSGKPEKVWDMMISGRVEKYYKDVCLLEQPFVKNPDISINDRITGYVAKVRENIVVRRFARYVLGGE
ncbi:translation elongation factor Ts [Candidatus Desantisbacteria bacterium CG2_30_40_21]|uniref:Elongation factor Ts n=3 Tax=unclassified Candidatus Desantisiibacteriota TaxID=3106372 RepID=A0A2M8AR03_9BACT|nr:MAG: translation elongation factor Ts [Candidatus Desantisbacteria bacterium CG2_30_40_21]PIP42047.1 MAG: translation elongation factor Ts [Candidatus Desantisbacteria bacterium CG23_combo_of_CG06-09_8_20_14_all_40_23]PJB28204.1 MAG: translation elongation factor Ts [Candidatus Desantisbacteria bacterium CG_4_9_14_3_um_filter_40_11]